MKTPQFEQPKPVKGIELVHQFISVFSVKIDGKTTHRVVSVPHTQIPDVDKAAAWAGIRAIFPKDSKAEVRRVSSSVRAVPKNGQPVVVLPKGATIRQLFPDGTEHETARLVGSVMFNEYPHEVVLRYVRGRSAVSVMLREIGTNTTARFSETFSAVLPATDLDKQIRKSLGGAIRDLNLFIEIKK